MKKVLIILVFFCLIACEKENSNYSAQINDELNYEDDYKDDYDANYIDPYPEYCFFGAKANIDNLKTLGDDCKTKILGNNRPADDEPNATGVVIYISGHQSLTDVGIKTFYHAVSTGNRDPKYSVGTYAMVPYSLFLDENKKLPNITASIIDFDSRNTLVSINSPEDAVKLMNAPLATPDSLPPFEIVTSTLKITHVEDLSLNEDELLTQKQLAKSGMLTGRQYVKGSISFMIKKLGVTGNNYGPQTFTFAGINDWSYLVNAED